MLLGAFLLIESRSKHALMPLRIFRNRNRSGAYLIMLCVGTAMFGMFFFLTIFVQTSGGTARSRPASPTCPMVAIIMAMAGRQRPAGPADRRPAAAASPARRSARGGMFWLSRINEHSTYAGGLLGPLIVTAAGLGMLFMPLTLIALSKVQDRDSGLASSLLNTGQQVGGSIGLAVLGTVAWTVVANTARSSAAHAQGGRRGRGQGRPPGARERRADRAGQDGDLRPRPVGRLLPRVRGVGAESR